jgi:hypothetical protein
MPENKNQHLSDRLIRIIEIDAEALARRAVKKLQSSTRTSAYHELPYNELYSRTYEVYRNLGHWMWDKSEEAVQVWCGELGKMRREERIPLSEVLWALILTKRNLLDYLGTCASADSALELYQQEEFDRVVSHFFDRAVCYTAEGYEANASVHERGYPEVSGYLWKT